jgi:hypothetical protein
MIHRSLSCRYFLASILLFTNYDTDTVICVNSFSQFFKNHSTLTQLYIQFYLGIQFQTQNKIQKQSLCYEPIHYNNKQCCNSSDGHIFAK